jgi:small subunit ribosomal protein S3
VEARTTYGVLGVKVWIYKGEIFDLHQAAKEEAGSQQAQA